MALGLTTVLSSGQVLVMFSFLYIIHLSIPSAKPIPHCGVHGGCLSHFCTRCSSHAPPPQVMSEFFLPTGSLKEHHGSIGVISEDRPQGHLLDVSEGSRSNLPVLSHLFTNYLSLSLQHVQIWDSALFCGSLSFLMWMASCD